MRIRAGTSGFSYAAWKGTFYPPKLPASRMLGAYASRLPTVEINATFYRMPQAKTLAAWRDAVPSSFVFALKGSRRVTHLKRLDGIAEDVAYFYRTAAELEGRLGPVLWQLPPTAKKDLGRLRELLSLLPRGGRAAIEFRHATWFGDDVLTALAGAGVALCISEDEERATPVVATAPFGYLRLRRPDYDAAGLAAWAERVRAQPWEEAFVFFKHEEEARGPEYALRFGALAQAEAEPAEIHAQP
ncbi:MAG TPA: DUF72 domain-containing protein [Anaeromyxobacteraceae bacterium]|nr:DUF72 domain-containing protein [Anaeromyxobacteraceae bacterium]